MSDHEVSNTAEPSSPELVPDDIASRILAGFKRGELPGWMSRTSYNSAILKIDLADGEPVSITAPTQRLAEAKESSNDAVLEILMKKADGEDVADTTLEEARPGPAARRPTISSASSPSLARPSSSNGRWSSATRSSSPRATPSRRSPR